jgi:hypothetical protein
MGDLSTQLAKHRHNALRPSTALRAGRFDKYFAGRKMTDMKAPISHSKNPVLRKAPQALLRASERDRLLAEQTGTPFIVRQSAKPSVTPSKRK